MDDQLVENQPKCPIPEHSILMDSIQSLITGMMKSQSEGDARAVNLLLKAIDRYYIRDASWSTDLLIFLNNDSPFLSPHIVAEIMYIFTCYTAIEKGVFYCEHEYKIH